MSDQNETVDVGAGSVDCTIQIAALEAESGVAGAGSMVASPQISEEDMRTVLCWKIFGRLGQLTGVPVALNEVIPVADLFRILGELEKILAAAGVQL